MTSLDLTGLFIVFGLLIAGVVGGALWLIIAGAARSARAQPTPPPGPGEGPRGGAGNSGASED